MSEQNKSSDKSVLGKLVELATRFQNETNLKKKTTIIKSFSCPDFTISKENELLNNGEDRKKLSAKDIDEAFDCPYGFCVDTTDNLEKEPIQNSEELALHLRKQKFDSEKRKNRMFMKGDLVIIACDNSFEAKYNFQRVFDSYKAAVGWYGHIIGITGNDPTIKMDDIKVEDEIMLRLKILNGPKIPTHYLYKNVEVLHTDVVNLTVLGEKVGLKLFEVSNESDGTYGSYERYMTDKFLCPNRYVEFAMKYVGDDSVKEEMYYAREAARIVVVPCFAEFQYEFRKLNRKLRWTVTYNRLHGLPSFPGLDDFDVYAESTDQL